MSIILQITKQCFLKQALRSRQEAEDTEKLFTDLYD